MLITIATMLVMAPPAGFSVKKDTVKIEPVVFYDGEGQKKVTEQPYLQVRLTVTNEADGPLAWPGFHQARVSYRERTEKLITGGAVLPVKFGPGPNCRWEQSVVTDQILNPGQKTTVLVVFDRPGSGGLANLTLSSGRGVRQAGTRPSKAASSSRRTDTRGYLLRAPQRPRLPGLRG